jgi:hypothetical protein
MLDQVGKKTAYYRKNSVYDQTINGYLSFLLGVRRYKKYHHQRLTTNFEGLRKSSPPLADGTWPVTITGDSFAFGSYNTDEDILSRKLEEQLGWPVRNLAFPGNPVRPVLDLLCRRENLSPIILWGVTERSITKKVFEPAVAFHGCENGMSDEKKVVQPAAKGFTLFREWFAVYAKDSCARWLANSLWGYVKFYVLREISGEIWTPLHPGMLFYRQGVMLMGREADAESLKIIAEGSENLARLCAQRGAVLIIFLIPDKCTVYPENVFDEGRREKLAKNRFIDHVAAALSARGLPVLNLRLSFLARKNEGLLYFPDDTHWNPRGIRLSAEIISSYLRERKLIKINRSLESAL